MEPLAAHLQRFIPGQLGKHYQHSEIGTRMESARELFEHEVQSLYDGAKRLSRGLEQMGKHASDPQLASKVDDLRKANEEHLRRLEEVFDLMGQKPSRSEAKTIRGMIEEFNDFVREQKPEKAPLDVYTAHAASDVAHYVMEEYQAMLLLAERSGIAHSSPKVSDLLKVSTKEAKKIGKDIQKLTESLVEQLRPA
jgi:ferritin-like metal-binding protein YciE